MCGVLGIPVLPIFPKQTTTFIWHFFDTEQSV